MSSTASKGTVDAEAVEFRGSKGPIVDIPKVDCRLVNSPLLQDRMRIAHEVGRACRETGFLYAVNDTISSDLEDRLYRSIKDFFDIPHEEEVKFHNSKSPVRRGYQYWFEGRSNNDARYGRSP